MLSILICAVLVNAAPSQDESNAQTPENESGTSSESLDFLDIEWLDIDLDVVSLEEGRIGVDYELERDWTVGEENSPETNYRIRLTSRGFLADSEARTQESIITALEFGGEFVHYDALKNRSTEAGRKARVARLRELYATLDPDSNPDADFSGTGSDPISEQIDRLEGRTHVRYLSWKGRLRHETDQDFDSQQFALGFGLTTDSVAITGDNTLAEWFDLPFKALRDPNSTGRPRPIRAYFGVDLVDASDNDERTALTGDDEYTRVTAELAWATTVLQDSLLTVRWQGYWELDADSAIEDADKDGYDYFEASVSLPAGPDGTSLLIQYSDGALPPIGEDEAVVGVGLQISF